MSEGGCRETLWFQNIYNKIGMNMACTERMEAKLRHCEIRTTHEVAGW
jgi:hypothetical protein